MSTKNYVAVCAVAVGKKIINPGEPIPSNVPAAKINAWLGNVSIKEGEGESSATLTGAVTKDGRVVELSKLKVEILKTLATDLKVSGVDQMKKEALIEAITAVEFAVEE